MLSNRAAGNLGRGADIPNALRVQTLNTRTGPRGNASGQSAGFDRTVDKAVTIGPDACVVVDEYCTIEAGGALTIEARGELLILSTNPPSFRFPYERVMSASGAIGLTDDLIVFNSASAIDVYLPPVALASGRYYRTSNKAAGIATMSGDANINGSASQSLNQYESVDLYSDGSVWIAR